MSRTDKAADRTATLLMLTMGGLAGAASFTHVVTLAERHGQKGWLAVAVAVSIELAAIIASLEIRRSRRAGQSTRLPFAVLVSGIGLSLAANVAEAHPTVWGWILAGTPAGAFLIVAKLAMGRADTPALDPVLDPVLEPVPAPVAVSLTREPAPAALPVTSTPAPALVAHAKRVATDHHATTGQPITVPALAQRLGIALPLATNLHTAITT